MNLEEIRIALIDLTNIRKNSEDSLMSSIQSSLLPKRPTYEEVYQKEKELEQKIPNYWVIFDRTNQCYGIIPITE